VFLVTGFLLGVAVVSFSVTVWVTPKVILLQNDGHNATSSSNCDGWPQPSFDGYFQCAVDLSNHANSQSHGLVVVDNATAPGATNVVVSPQILTVYAGSSGTVRVSGQLGYSGDVTIYIGVYG